MIRNTVGLVYLGRMGAGSDITFTLAKQLIQRGVSVRLVLSSNVIDLGAFDALNVPIHLVHMSNPRWQAFLPFKASKIKNISHFLQPISVVYFPMPHPRDNQVIRSLLKNGFPVGRGIHDIARHPGDIWPNKLSVILQKRYSDFLIAHSYFVASKLSSNNVTVIPLPRLEGKVLYQPIRGLVVFIGRLRTYKGLKLLLTAWKGISRLDPSFALSISGSGKLKLGELTDSISIDRNWLTKEQIVRLISRANCLVFPYIEASQSGLLPVIDSLEIPLVVTNVGGLVEQVSAPSSLVVGPESQEVATAILQIIDDWKPIVSERIAEEEKGLAEFLVGFLNSFAVKL